MLGCRKWLVALTMVMGISCSDGSDEDTHAHEHAVEKDVLCCELGAVCHVVGETDEAVSECHEIGHKNDPDLCKAEYERCLEVCEGATDEPVEHACE